MKKKFLSKTQPSQSSANTFLWLNWIFWSFRNCTISIWTDFHSSLLSQKSACCLFWKACVPNLDCGKISLHFVAKPKDYQMTWPLKIKSLQSALDLNILKNELPWQPTINLTPTRNQLDHSDEYGFANGNLTLWSGRLPMHLTNDQ